MEETDLSLFEDQGLSFSERNDEVKASNTGIDQGERAHEVKDPIPEVDRDFHPPEQQIISAPPKDPERSGSSR
jgi:hypothetical protein